MRVNLTNDRSLDLTPSRGRASLKPTIGRAPGSLELDAAVATAGDYAAAASDDAAAAAASAATAATFDPADFIEKPATGTTGQVLKKTASAAEWDDPDPALPAGGTGGQILTKQSGTDYDAAWGDPPESGSAGFTRLVRVTRTAASSSTYSVTSAGSPTDVDATNLAATFTVPASGSVIVRLTATCEGSGGGDGYWSLRQGSSNVAGSERRLPLNAPQAPYTFWISLTGLTPGASLTWKWAWRTFATFTLRYGRSAEFSGSNAYPPLEMEVWAI